MKIIKIIKPFIIIMFAMVALIGCGSKKSLSDNETDISDNDDTFTISDIFSDQEIEECIKKAYEYFDARNAKDNDLILSKTYPEKAESIRDRVSDEKTFLYDESAITISDVEYYNYKGRTTIERYTEMFGAENFMILKATIEVVYPEGIVGSWTEGTFPGFSITFVKDSEDSQWYYYDSGW